MREMVIHHQPTTGRRQPRRALAVGTGLVALSAWGGTVGLIGGFLGLPADIEARLPFASPVFGGLALATVVAAPMSTVAWLAWRGDPRTGPAAVAAGGLQVGWIVVQVAFIRELSFFHPTYLAIGAAVIAAGRRRTTATGSPP